MMAVCVRVQRSVRVWGGVSELCVCLDADVMVHVRWVES